VLGKKKALVDEGFHVNTRQSPLPIEVVVKEEKHVIIHTINSC